MGKGLFYQSHITPGIECVAVCDLKIERCIEAASLLQLDYEIVNGPESMVDAIRRGRLAICENGQWVSQCEILDAVIEASSAIGPAAEHSISALEHRKHLILMNSEIDLIFGPLLLHEAKKNGVVCTSCDGDQYGVIKHLIDDLTFWGFDLVMAGNIKGFLDRYANPTTIVPEADKRNLDYRMCTSYTDGTKLSIEMAIIANAYGLSTKIPGMYGPRAHHVSEVFRSFDLPSLWEKREPFVDYILGAEPGGGVFAIGYCDNPFQKNMLAYYKMGSGPYYLFYRPYHLCHIEAMDTVIKAVSENRCLLQPSFGFQTNVYAYAKCDLEQGALLDGIGGYTCYGQIENCDENPPVPGLPVCLTENLALRRAISKDEKILLDDIIFDPQRSDFRLYAQALKLSDVLRTKIVPGHKRPTNKIQTGPRDEK